MAAAAPGAGGGASGGGAPAAPQQCDYCSTPKVDASWLEAFQVAMCWECKKQDSLISKSKAKSMYLLGDSDLSKLGSLEKPNPQHKAWSSMRMYLNSQVQEVAIRKHGSLSAIDQIKNERADKKFAQQAAQRKRDAAAGGLDERQQAQLEARIEARSARLAREAREAERAVIEEFVDPETGAKRRRHGPQLADVEVEQI